MVLVYEASPGYYYLVKDNPTNEKRGKKGKKEKRRKKIVKRISEEEYQKKTTGYNHTKDSIKVGDKVTVIIKPYKDGKYVTGMIKKILTKKKIHTRGHKVMLKDGTVGRMVRKEK